MKIKLVVAAALLLIAALFAYRQMFKPMSDDYILAHGWKGGGCGLPDVLDFRGERLSLRGDNLYRGESQLGWIVNRVHRSYADSYIDVLSVNGETCRFWAKWAN